MLRVLWMLFVCGLGSALWAAPGGTPKPAPTPTPAKARVVEIGSDYHNYCEGNNYDGLPADLGWTFDKVDNTAFAAFTDKLANDDIVLGTSLFNYSHPQNLLERRDAVLGWLRAGGALALTDTNYVEHTDFLKNLGPGYEATVKPCHSNGMVQDVDASYQLLRWPNVWQPRSTWAHMELGAKWRVLARCSEGAPIFAVAEFGRGFIILHSAQRVSNDELVNVWHTLQLRRAGVVELSADGWDKLAPGACTAQIALKTDQGQPATVVWRVAESNGKVVSTKAVVRDHARLTLKSRCRGVAHAWLEVTAQGGQTYVGPVHTVTVPDLLDAQLAAPLYRNYALLGARPSTVRVQFTAWPYGDRRQSAVGRLQLLQNGRSAGEKEVVVPLRAGATASVELPAGGLQPGAFQAVATSLIGGRVQSQRTFALEALPERNAQTVFDDHMGTRVDGRPFFPIGVYHVPDDQLDKAKAMGFNCVQMWGGKPDVCQRSLDLAQAHGLKVLLEMSDLLHDKYQPDTLLASVRAVKDHPALLAWYTVDEPFGPRYGWSAAAYKLCRQEDPNHPTFLVSCDPTLFNAFAPCVDVLAIDPYPVDRSPLYQVSNWASAVAQAVGADHGRPGSQPWFLVPQVHNQYAYQDAKQGRAPYPNEEWAMVAAGLVHGARGLVYYAWEDGPVGLTHEPALQAELPKINELFNQIGVELVESDRVVISPDGSHDVQAAVFTGARRLLIAANLGDQPASVNVPRASSLRSLREGVAAPALVAGQLTLAPTETVVAEIVP